MYSQNKKVELTETLRSAALRAAENGIHTIIEHALPCCKTDEQREALERAKSRSSLKKIAEQFVKENPYLTYSISRRDHLNCEYLRQEAVQEMLERYEGLTAEQIRERQIDAVFVLKEIGDVHKLERLRERAKEFGYNNIAAYTDYFISKLGGKSIISTEDPCKNQGLCPFNDTNCPKQSQKELDDIAEATSGIL